MNERREQALAKWRVLVAEQEQSGQSVAAFCQNRELAQSKLIYWKRRLRGAAKAPFVEVQLAQPGVEPRVQACALGGRSHAPKSDHVASRQLRSATRVYGFFGPFWALPSGFLTGFSAAAGLALINSAGNLAGFVGPYAIGVISKTTGSLYAGLALAGVFMFAAAILVLFLPKSADVRKA